MGLNIELFEKVIAAIEAEPERLRMERFFSRKQGDESECGTTYDIAAWACVLSGATPTDFRADDENDEESSANVITANGTQRMVEYFAAEMLGMGKGTTKELFWYTCWNSPDAEAYEDAETPQERAAITVKVIREFIAANS